MGKLTAFLIVRNEEVLLPRCLASLAEVVDAIVVIDTGSCDRTLRILAEAQSDPHLPPLLFLQRPFRIDGGFGAARQAALDLVRTEWAFWIDADEVVLPALGQAIRELIRSGAIETCDVWEIPLENRVFGRIMHGRNLSGQYRPRLFRCRCARITPSVVHEGLQVAPDARRGRLGSPIRHDTLTSWKRYLAKVRHYTDLETAAAPRRFDPVHMLVTGPATMWREFVWRQGYRDGWPGFVWAVTTAWASVRRDWVRMWPRRRSEDESRGGENKLER